MKNKALSLLLAGTMILLLFTGCGGASNSSGSSAESSDKNSNTESTESEDPVESEDTTESEEATVIDETIKIDDIEWNVDEGIVNGDRFVLASYTNNSPFSLSEFQITFREKSDITEDQRSSQLDTLKKVFEVSDEDFEELKTTAFSAYFDSDVFTDIGETITDVNLYYYSGIYYLKNIDFYSLLEPDIATIKYVNGNKIYTTYYDFHSGKYSTDSETEDAITWSKTSVGDMIPKPDSPIIKMGFSDDETGFSFDAYGFSLEKFNAYIDECKSLGFTVDPSEYEGFYAADNDQGTHIYASYNESSRSFYMTIDVPENSTDTAESSDTANTSTDGNETK